MNRPTRLLSILTALILLLAACGSAGDDEPNGSDASPSPGNGDTPFPIVEETRQLTDGSDANFHDEDDVTDEDDVEIVLSDNYFEPTILLGEAGQELTLQAINEGINIHNLSLTEQEVDQDLSVGDKQDIEVTFPESGALTFFCKYHLELGMRGELRVVG